MLFQPNNALSDPQRGDDLCTIQRRGHKNLCLWFDKKIKSSFSQTHSFQS